MIPPRSDRRLVLALLSVLLLLYVSSYVVFSRRGYAEAEHFGFKGFYYLTPQNSDSWRFMNYSLVLIYSPLNKVDQWIGLGRGPAAEPLWALE